jgi:hypothetical protein
MVINMEDHPKQAGNYPAVYCASLISALTMMALSCTGMAQIPGAEAVLPNFVLIQLISFMYMYLLLGKSQRPDQNYNNGITTNSSQLGCSSADGFQA